MITVAIIGILSAVALPMYRDYVTRSRLVEAFSALSGVQAQAEQFWSNNRTFESFDRLPANTGNFTYALSDDTTSTYTVTATGVDNLAGFVFTIDQSGARATTGVPEEWTTNDACWVDRKDGSCTE